jgi:lipid-binding SYLF domain-containing protein
MRISLWLILPALGLALALTATLSAQTREAMTVDDATEVLNEMMMLPARRIPESLLADAQALVIVPDLLKGGFVLGIRYGRGIVVVRDERGMWGAPEFVTLTGGSIGYQIGIQATDIVLVFKTRTSVQGLLNGKFTLGADAAAAAGPVGREAAAATDGMLRAEIYTYSRSRGLFAGVSLDGSVLQMDRRATASYYATPTMTSPCQPRPLPPSAARLLQTVAQCTLPAVFFAPAAAAGQMAQPAGQMAQSAGQMLQPAGQMVPVAGQPTLARRPANPPAADPRQQLADASLRLYAVVDDSWKAYLALPAEIYAGDRQPSAEAISRTLARFDTVTQDARYRLLAQTVEFRTTHDLLRQYLAVASRPNSPALALPGPPR